jgi:RNA polymerase sigma factor (sigma-70 family)
MFIERQNASQIGYLKVTPEQLHKEFEKDLFHFVLGKTKDKALAEDVCQETWVRAWDGEDEDEGKFDGSKSWLFTVAAHLAADHFRLYKRRPTVGLEDLIERECRAFEDKSDADTEAANTQSNDLDDSEGNEDEDEDEDESAKGATCVVNEKEADDAKAKKKAIKARARVEAAREKSDAESNPERRYLEGERKKTLTGLLSRIDPVHRAVIEATFDGRTLSEIANETNTPISTVKARYHRGKAKLTVLARNGGVRLIALDGPVRCGSIECRRERHVFYAGR